MSNTETQNLPTGALLDGKYKVDKQVGIGGMGAVYMATHTTIGRRVAIKALHAEFACDEHVVARFHREAQLAGSIGHDNICEVTDIGTLENGSPYLVMPLLQGLPLSDVLENGKLLTLDRVVDIGGQTLSALAAAHNANIVHRDLKPDNIFITKMGDREDFVKLLDFGISKIMEQDEISALTMTGTVLGTPFYMSPEQAKGAKNLDHRVDIYAMGVILYEALTGSRPYEGDTYNELMFKIVAEPFPMPSTINPSIPPEVEKVIVKAMSKEPEDRFASSEKMKKALEAAALGQSIDFDTRISNEPSTEDDRPYTPALGMSGSKPLITAQTHKTKTTIKKNGGSKKLLLIAGLSVFVALLVVVAVMLVLFSDDSNEPQTIAPINTVPLITPQSLPAPTDPKPATTAADVVKQDDQADTPLLQPIDKTTVKEVLTNQVAKKKKKIRKKKPVASSKAPKPSASAAGGKKTKKTVGGRFNTTFVGDYGD